MLGMVGVATQHLSRIPGGTAQVVDDGGSRIAGDFRRGIQLATHAGDGGPSALLKVGGNLPDAARRGRVFGVVGWSRWYS